MYRFEPGSLQNGIIRGRHIDYVKLNRKTKVPYAYLQSDFTMYNLFGYVIGHNSGVRWFDLRLTDLNNTQSG